MSDDIRKVLDQFGQNTQAALIGLALAMVKDEEEKKAKPDPSPAQRLVDLANGLPQEVFGSEKDDAIAGSFVLNRSALNPIGYKRHDGPAMCNEKHFRRWLLGVMSDFVGTEPGAHVQRKSSVHPESEPFAVWWYVLNGEGYHMVCPHEFDTLVGYQKCCLAIAEKRRAKA